MILPRTWALLRDAVDVLMQATPRGIKLDEVREQWVFVCAGELQGSGGPGHDHVRRNAHVSEGGERDGTIALGQALAVAKRAAKRETCLDSWADS